MKLIKVFLKTFFLFIFTIGIIACAIIGFYQWRIHKAKTLALEKIPDPKVNLPYLVENPLAYEQTIQSWGQPALNQLLFPRAWLDGEENCIFAARMNSMKFAGMLPSTMTIKQFKQNFTNKEVYREFGLHVWDVNLNSKILNRINQKLNPNSAEKYEWINLTSMDEVIYLARRGQHILIGITVWLAPDKKHPEPRRNRNAPISHAITITGIKSYDPVSDIIEFSTYEPLPFNDVSYVPVYSKFNPKGWSLFKRQGVPYIHTSGRARSGYVVKIPALSKNKPTITLKKNKES
jgi:hypothetical protein